MASPGSWNPAKYRLPDGSRVTREKKTVRTKVLENRGLQWIEKYQSLRGCTQKLDWPGCMARVTTRMCDDVASTSLRIKVDNAICDGHRLMSFTTRIEIYNGNHIIWQSVRECKTSTDMNDYINEVFFGTSSERQSWNKNKNKRTNVFAQAVNEVVWTICNGRLLCCLLVTVEIVISTH